MTVVAVRKDKSQTLETYDGGKTGVIVNVDGSKTEPFNLQSILSRGYWVEPSLMHYGTATSGRYPKGSGANEPSTSSRVPDDVRTAMGDYIGGMHHADAVEKSFPPNIKDYGDGVVDDDGSPVQEYVYDGYNAINDYLRSPPTDVNLSGYYEIEDRVAAIGDAINEAPTLPSGTILYRGVGPSSGPTFVDKPIGTICEDPAFQSHSLDPNVAERFAKMWEPTKGDYHQTVIRAIVDGNQKAVYINRVGKAQILEHEALLQRGSRWKIVGKDQFKISKDSQKGEPWETTTMHVITVVPAEMKP